MDLKKMPIIDEIKISYKRTYYYNTKITCSRDAWQLALEVLGDEIEYKEFFYVIAMNNNSEVLGVKKISEGGITGTMVDSRIVLQTLLKAHAVTFIVFHNHPSGVLKASDADKMITAKLKRAGEFLDIKLLDHIIATKKDYLSFADEFML